MVRDTREGAKIAFDYDEKKHQSQYCDCLQDICIFFTKFHNGKSIYRDEILQYDKDTHIPNVWFNQINVKFLTILI